MSDLAMTDLNMSDEHWEWPRVLALLFEGKDIGADLAECVMSSIMSGDTSDVHVASFLTAMTIKGESVSELVGMAKAMLSVARRFELAPEVVDIAGTGGAQSRQLHALNISTMACFVSAAAGAVVCKHGNLKASSTSGSFDFLKALGVPIVSEPSELQAGVRRDGIGFAYARALHPAMRHVANVRAELGIPTSFNILGPLSHPGQVTRQALGVSNPDWFIKAAQVLQSKGSYRAMVVHGSGGLDELTTAGVSQVADVQDGAVRYYDVHPNDLGLQVSDPKDLQGGTPTENVKLFEAIIAGEVSARRDIVAVNAAAGLTVSGVVENLKDGVEASIAAIEDGQVAALVDRICLS